VACDCISHQLEEHQMQKFVHISLHVHKKTYFVVHIMHYVHNNR